MTFQTITKSEQEPFTGTNDHGRMRFGLNIYSNAAESETKFVNINNLYLPLTIAACFNHTRPDDPSPGIKTDAGKWETRGHARRIITITEHELSLFARLFEDGDTPPLAARLPQIHSQDILTVLQRFASVETRLGDLEGEYLATEMFHESNAQRDGIITRQEAPSFQPTSPDEWVISGPHFYVGTPLNKSPRSSCLANTHYDDIDLTDIPADYLPRAVYRPGNQEGGRAAFYSAIPEWPRPGHPGFWPIHDDDISAWEALLGELLKLYRMDPSRPGATTARQFAYLSVWEGPVEEALAWLRQHGQSHRAGEFTERFATVRVAQKAPSTEEMQRLPIPFTARYRVTYRNMCQPANERTLIGAISPCGFSVSPGSGSSDDQRLCPRRNGVLFALSRLPYDRPHGLADAQCFGAGRAPDYV